MSTITHAAERDGALATYFTAGYVPPRSSSAPATT
jgi:hypothetical protein